MNRIKDFFYDKNDIIVTLIILAAAALIIFIRVDKIMAYPETLTDTNTASSSVSQEQSPASSETAASNVKSVSITEDATPAAVAKQLEETGIVSSASDFEAALKKYKMTDSILSGTFQIPDGATTDQIIEIITGQSVSGD